MPKKENQTSPADDSPQPQQRNRSREALANRRRRTQMRRHQIFAGALQCFQTRGYHETTLNDIAKTAGISSGLIYQYFADKRDVLFQVILDIVEAYRREIPLATMGIEHPLKRLWAGAEAYFRVVDSNIDGTLLAYRETKLLDRGQIDILKSQEIQTNDIILQHLKDCVEAGYCKDENQELMIYMMLTSAHMWALKNWRLKNITTHGEYFKFTMQRILVSSLTPEGLKHARTLGLVPG